MPAGFRRRSKAREDNPIDYLVHVRKLALPLFPQFGLEPNVYYIPPVHAPRSFLRQMFGPGVDQAIDTYRGAADDPDLARPAQPVRLDAERRAALEACRATRSSALTRAVRRLVRVPLREPVHIREAFDSARGVVRTNVP